MDPLATPRYTRSTTYEVAVYGSHKGLVGFIVPGPGRSSGVFVYSLSHKQGFKTPEEAQRMLRTKCAKDMAKRGFRILVIRCSFEAAVAAEVTAKVLDWATSMP